jgi:hypothetical protein
MRRSLYEGTPLAHGSEGGRRKPLASRGGQTRKIQCPDRYFGSPRDPSAHTWQCQRNVSDPDDLGGSPSSRLIVIVPTPLAAGSDQWGTYRSFPDGRSNTMTGAIVIAGKSKQCSVDKLPQLLVRPILCNTSCDLNPLNVTVALLSQLDIMRRNSALFGS